MADTLVTAVEGPRGKAEIYEIAKPEPSGGQRFVYTIRFNSTETECLSLGEAYITAGELAGVKT